MSLLSVSVQPETKIMVDALSTLLQTSAGRVVDILALAYVQALPPSEADVIRQLKDAALARIASEGATPSQGSSVPVVQYKFSRLCFKRDLIEALRPGDAFRVDTPVGSFQMTKADFYRVFSNVTRSASYLESGMYHYRTLPGQAEPFRIA